MQYDFLPRSEFVKLFREGGTLYLVIIKKFLIIACGVFLCINACYFLKRISNYSKFFLLCAQLRTSGLRLPVFLRPACLQRAFGPDYKSLRISQNAETISGGESEAINHIAYSLKKTQKNMNFIFCTLKNLKKK